MKPDLNVQAIIDSLRSVLPADRKFIGLHEPEFSGNEWTYVKDCLDTGWVSSVGAYVDRFEEMLREFTGVNYAVAVVNGTAALHVCLQLVGVKEEDEVLIPALTFVATANAVHYCGAIPHFVDSEFRTLGLDPIRLGEYLREISVVRGKSCYNKFTGRRIKAVVPMHTFGHPVDLDPLVDICARFHLELIEDAAESLGSYYKGKHTGHFGRVAALSFNGNKIVTTGGGGAILTNDERLGKIAKHLTTTAKVPHKWAFYHDQVGYNYRLPNINAALGCAQLEELPHFLDQKRKLTEIYVKAFKDLRGVVLFTEPAFVKSNYWLQTLIVDEAYAEKRNELLELSNTQGLMTRPAWTLMSDLPMFQQCPSMELPVARSLEARIVNIPSSAHLGRKYG